MILSDSRGQTVDFWSDSRLPLNPKKIGIELSGGTDSALLLYITCLFFNDVTVNDVEIIPVTSNRIGYLDDTPGANKIIQIIRDIFPGNNIRDTEDHTYARVYPEPFNKINLKEFVDRNEIDVLLHGRTMSPDLEIDEEVYGSETHFIRKGGNYDLLENKHGTKYYHPFGHVDKKWVKSMYDKFGLLENLFPETVSCVTLNEFRVDKNPGPCKKCFWCLEKYWAFNCYDGGVK